jgi:NADH-quinone oxidoreductase B subunit
MFIFLGILILGLAYVWVKGDLDWIKPNPTVPDSGTNIPQSLYDKINLQQSAFKVKEFSLEAPIAITNQPPTLRLPTLQKSLCLNQVLKSLPMTPDLTNESGGVVVTKMNDLLNWARLSSLWPLSFGIACCAIEMMGAMASTYDLDRFGVFPRPSSRQADVIIIAGTVTFKMAERIKRLYEQMPDPKYVISMGSCSNCGGPYWQHGYHVVKGVDRVIPVDVYVQGCPPRPEALIGAILELQKKIEQESLVG